MSSPPEASASSGSDRTIVLEGADNVRDLGGLPTADGILRRGRLFRGALVPALRAADLALLRDRVGLRTVLDLRTQEEVSLQPGTWVEHGISWIHCPFMLGGSPPVPGGRIDYGSMYAGFLEDSPEAILLAVSTLIAPGALPALFHCAAGKDRTGVLSALVLDLLGVPREAIVADYVLTGEAMERVVARLGELEPYASQLLSADPADYEPKPEMIVDFLDLVDRRFAGSERWLLDHGMNAASVERFRREMSVSADLRAGDAG